MCVCVCVYVYTYIYINYTCMDCKPYMYSVLYHYKSYLYNYKTYRILSI